MKKSSKKLLLLALLLYTIWGECGTLLGKISDETSQAPSVQEPVASGNKPKIIYRVICSHDGEKLPECEQPPVDDFFDANQPRPIELEKTSQDQPQNQAVDTPVPQKALKHKKHNKHKKLHKHSKRHKD